MNPSKTIEIIRATSEPAKLIDLPEEKRIDALKVIQAGGELRKMRTPEGDELVFSLIVPKGADNA